MAFLYEVGDVLMHAGVDLARTLSVKTTEGETTTTTKTTALPQRLFVVNRRTIGGGGEDAANVYGVRGLVDCSNVQTIGEQVLDLYEHELIPYTEEEE